MYCLGILDLLSGHDGHTYSLCAEIPVLGMTDILIVYVLKYKSWKAKNVGGGGGSSIRLLISQGCVCVCVCVVPIAFVGRDSSLRFSSHS